MMCMSLVVLLIGMLAGIAIGIQQNFTLMPVHAHLNLIGGVLLFLFGLYYKRVPPPEPRPSQGFRGGCAFGAVLFRPVSLLVKGPSFVVAPIECAGRLSSDGAVCDDRIPNVTRLTGFTSPATGPPCRLRWRVSELAMRIRPRANDTGAGILALIQRFRSSHANGDDLIDTNVSSCQVMSRSPVRSVNTKRRLHRHKTWTVAHLDSF
jgi:hypothetical protein